MFVVVFIFKVVFILEVVHIFEVVFIFEVIFILEVVFIFEVVILIEVEVVSNMLLKVPECILYEWILSKQSYKLIIMDRQATNRKKQLIGARALLCPKITNHCFTLMM